MLNKYKQKSMRVCASHFNILKSQCSDKKQKTLIKGGKPQVLQRQIIYTQGPAFRFQRATQ